MKLALAAAVAAAVLGTAPTLAAATYVPTAEQMAGVPINDQKMIRQCLAMKHDAMMKNAMCLKMMQLYPQAFAGSVSSN